jgi:hypothetical protein
MLAHHERTHTLTHARMHAHTRAHAFRHITWMHACAHTRARAHTHTHTHTHTHPRTHMCARTHARKQQAQSHMRYGDNFQAALQLPQGRCYNISHACYETASASATFFQEGSLQWNVNVNSETYFDRQPASNGNCIFSRLRAAVPLSSSDSAADTCALLMADARFMNHLHDRQTRQCKERKMWSLLRYMGGVRDGQIWTGGPKVEK